MSKKALVLVALLAVVIGFAAGHRYALRANPMAAIELPDSPPPSDLAGRSTIIDALLIRDPFQRIQALAAVLGRSGPEAVPDAIEALEAQGIDIEPEVPLLLRFWAQYDPEAATQYAIEKPALTLRPIAVAGAVEQWASQDPLAAAEGIRRVTSGIRGTVSEVAEVALMRGWFDSGQYAGLEDYLLGLGPTFEQQRCIAAFARRMVQRAGPDVARQWAEALPEEPFFFKIAAYRQVGSELTKADPAAGRAWCDEYCEGPFGKGIRQIVARRWAEQDAPAALEWLSKAPESGDRKIAVTTAYRRWWQLDQDAAARWLESIGIDGMQPWLAPAVGIYAPVLARTDPQEALQWAAVADDDRKTSVLISIARSWHEQDPAAADAWIEQSPLSPQQRKRARGEEIKKGRRRQQQQQQEPQKQEQEQEQEQNTP